MKIRVFLKKDSKELSRLLKEFLSYTRKYYSKRVLEFDNYTNSRKISYIKEILNNFKNQKHSRFLIAEEESKIVGYIMGVVDKNPDKVMKKSGHIKSFFVSEKSREKGVGKKLYLSLVDWFKKQKCDHLELDVFDGNEKTISMYKKWGFKENLIKLKKRL